MSNLICIFGDNLQELEEEWRELEMEPSYGSVKNDLLVQHWDGYFDPAAEFKK